MKFMQTYSNHTFQEQGIINLFSITGTWGLYNRLCGYHFFLPTSQTHVHMMDTLCLNIHNLIIYILDGYRCTFMKFLCEKSNKGSAQRFGVQIMKLIPKMLSFSVQVKLKVLCS